MPRVVDILPIADSNDESARLADLIEGVAGELSPFDELHGFSIDGVDLDTAVLPDGWRATDWSSCRTQTQQRRPGNPASPAGASTRWTSASQSWLPYVRRTATSSPRYSRRTLSTSTSSHRGCGPSRVNTSAATQAALTWLSSRD